MQSSYDRAIAWLNLRVGRDMEALIESELTRGIAFIFDKGIEEVAADVAHSAEG